MKFFNVEKKDNEYIITEVDYNINSQRYQWAKQNLNLFPDKDLAEKFILTETQMKYIKIFDDYSNITSKKDFEKLFDVSLNDDSYSKIKAAIDYLLMNKM